MHVIIYVVDDVRGISDLHKQFCEFVVGEFDELGNFIHVFNYYAPEMLLEASSHFIPDIIVTDQEMNEVKNDVVIKKMSGLELVKAVKKIHSGCFCIMITGAEGVKNKMLAEGVDAFFSKPVSFQEFEEVLSVAISEKMAEKRGAQLNAAVA